MIPHGYHASFYTPGSKALDEGTQTGNQRDCVVRQNRNHHEFVGSHHKDLGFGIGRYQARDPWR